MHNFVKISVAACSAIVLCACTGSVKVNMSDKSYTTDNVCVNAQIPQLSGLGDREFQGKINMEYISSVGKRLDEFEKSAKKSAGNAELETSTTEYLNSNGFLSIVTQIDYSVRKTKKNSCRITKNIDVDECREVKLGDLFTDEGYIDIINALIDEEVSGNPDKYADLWQKPRVRSEQSFFIDGEHLVLYYPPYELSYYERGFVEISIDFEGLATCLKEEYKRCFSGSR